MMELKEYDDLDWSKAEIRVETDWRSEHTSFVKREILRVLKVQSDVDGGQSATVEGLFRDTLFEDKACTKPYVLGRVYGR